MAALLAGLPLAFGGGIGSELRRPLGIAMVGGLLLSQALTLSLDLDRTLRLAVTRIADFMQAEAVSLFLIDTTTGLLVCRNCAGPVDITGLKLSVGQGVVGRTVSENATQIVRDAQTDARLNANVDAETGFITRSIVCTPLTTAHGAIGALEVINRRDGGLFDEDDAEILRLIAAPAALASQKPKLGRSCATSAAAAAVASGMMPSTTPPCEAGTCAIARAMNAGKPMIVQSPVSMNSSQSARGSIGRRSTSSRTKPVQPAIVARAADRNSGSKVATATRVAGSVPPNSRTPAKPRTRPNFSWDVGVMRRA